MLERWAGGSYRSELRWNAQGTSRDRTPILVRVITHTLSGASGATTTYRLVTTILEPARGPAAELAVLYYERWEVETAFDEFRPHLRGARRVLRSKTPELVRREAWGFLPAHFAIRALMHEAALGRVVPRGVKREMSHFPLRPRRRQRTQRERDRVRVFE